MDAEIQKRLREKFDTRVIGMKPTIWCRNCKDAIKNRNPSCDQHSRKRCKPSPEGCGQNITEAHLHIEFVSHAEVTDRLLEVDPGWSWEPVAFGPDGLPALTREGGLWIRLTVAGVTRIGYGGCDNKQGDDGIKEAVSDAIKTTAMRFGVALDLWRKSEESGKSANDLAARQEHAAPQSRNGAQTGRQAAPDAPAPSSAGQGDPMQARAALAVACDQNSWDIGKVAALFASAHDGVPLGECTDALAIAKFRTALFKLPQTELVATAVATNGAAQ